MPKVIGAHLRRKRLDELRDELVQGVDRTGGAFAQRCLQPGKGLLDWIEIGRVGRQIAHAGADSLDRLAGTGDLVSAQVIHEDLACAFAGLDKLTASTLRSLEY